MNAPVFEAQSATEAAAFAIYEVFVREGAGGRLPPDERWMRAPQATRDEFIRYAEAARPFFEAQP